MSYILTDLVTRVRNRIRDSSYDTTEIVDALNDTQYDVFNEYDLPFMEATQTYTVTVNVSDITNGVGLPANYVHAIDLVDTSTGREQTIPYRQRRASDVENPSQDTQPASYPQYWYKYANTIRLFPKPAGAYTLTLRYYKSPTVLSGDSDIPDIPSPFGEVLLSGAAYRILQVKDQYDQAAIHQNKYDEGLQKMVVKYSQVQTDEPFIMPVNRIGGTSYTSATGNF